MAQGKRIARAIAIAALLMSTLSGSAFAAKVPDPDPGYVCFGFAGMIVCVPVRG
jgi:hypothetical protein